MRTILAFSISEVLVVLAVLGIAGSFWALWSRPIVEVEAIRLASVLNRLRFVAVASGAAVGGLCGGVSPLRPAVAVRAWPPRGLLFTPDGLPRTCDGGGVGNTTILLEHRGRQAAVIVSSLGRVRWELR